MNLKKAEPVVGDGALIDEGVLLGYPSGRRLQDRRLVIGMNAVIRSGTIIYEGSTIGNQFETGHNVIIREENTIGHGVSIWSNTVIDYGCKIGNGVKVHCNVYIPQYTTIEDYGFIAPGASFANDLHPGCDRYPDCMQGPHIGKGAQVGVNVTILPKVHIGENALIGAGSVVTRDVPPYAVVRGNPGQVVGDVRDLECRSGLKTKPYNY